MDVDHPRGTVTFLFSDIEGSTRLSREHGSGYGDLRAEHRDVLRRAVAAHNGVVVDSEGDAFFAAFRRATEAVTAAITAQRELAASGPVRVRIGVHTTEPHLHRDGYIGVGVTRAARICAAAHGGQVVLSQVTAGIVEDQNVPGVHLRDLGHHDLKDITGAQRLFQVEAEGLLSDFPPLAASAAGSIATLVATDVAGWTAVMRTLGDDTAVDVSGRYHRIVDEQARAHDGRLVEGIADFTISVFPAVERAVPAAAAIRRALRERDWIPEVGKPEVRIAIHSGRLVTGVAGRLGSAAARVARLCAIADGGQIVVSHATQALLEGHLLPDFELRDLGDRELPGVDEVARVYELVERPTANRSAELV